MNGPTARRLRISTFLVAPIVAAVAQISCSGDSPSVDAKDSGALPDSGAPVTDTAGGGDSFETTSDTAPTDTATADTATADTMPDTASDAADAGGDAAACSVTAKFGAPTIVAGAINSTANDDGIWFVDPFTVFVSSSRSVDGGAAGYNLFSGARTSATATFATLDLLASLSSTTAGFGSQSPSLTADGKTIFFTRGSGGDYDIWTATRSSTLVDFGAPSLVASPVNVGGGGPGEDANLWVSGDGTRLYFFSNRAGSSGRDIYLTTRTGLAPFGTPTAVAALNSSGTEAGLALTADELQAFISSNRDGGYRVYYSSRTKITDGLSPPVEIPELNVLPTPSPLWVSPDGCTLYVGAASTDAGVGGYDIWVTTRGK